MKRVALEVAIAAMVATTALLTGCSAETSASDAPAKPLETLPGAAVIDAPPSAQHTLFDRPWPNQHAKGPYGFKNPKKLGLVASLIGSLAENTGFPTVQAAFFRFDAALPELSGAVIPATPDAPILWFIQRGDTLVQVPVTAKLLQPDPYVPENSLAITPAPGHGVIAHAANIVLIRRSLGDANGKQLGAPLPHRQRLCEMLGKPICPQASAITVPTTESKIAVAALKAAKLSIGDIAAFTAWTTGDAPRALHELGNKVLAAHSVTIEGLHLDPDDGADHTRFCELHGHAWMPQFQAGEPPFNTKGLFELGSDGLPKVQRQEKVPVAIVIPKQPMPAGGWPLVMYQHGSGGLSTQLVDRGPIVVKGGPNLKGRGPAHELARDGIAVFGSAQPVNKERLPGASSTAYINLANLTAYRDTVRQGNLEQRLLLDALAMLLIPPKALAGCAGPSLPSGETSHRFATDNIGAMGQSQGGFYNFMLAATEPRVKVTVPTGAGGFWSHYILITERLNVAPLAGALLGTSAKVDRFHPAMVLLQTAWAPVESMAYAARVHRDPIVAGQPTHLFEPVAEGDSFYPTELFDALAVAGRTPQVGKSVWPGTQQALKTVGLDGALPHPVKGNIDKGSAGKVTAALQQYEGDGISDPHHVFMQLPGLRYQWRCFLASGLKNAVPTLPTAATPDADCPPYVAG